MADTTLGRFVFEFISDTSSLEKGNASAAQSSEELALAISKVSISNDNLMRQMMAVAQIMAQAAKATEGMTSSQQHTAESIDDLTREMITQREELKELTDAQADQRDEADKTDKQVDKQGRGLSSFTKKLLALGAAYFTVGKLSGVMNKTFSETLQIVNLSRLIDVNASSLKNWRNVAQGLTGDGKSVAETFKNISMQAGELELLPADSDLLRMVNRLGITVRDEIGNMLSPDKIFLNLVDAVNKFDLGKNERFFLFSSFGITEEMQQVAGLGRNEIEKRLQEQRETQRQFDREDEENIEKLQKQISQVKQSAESLFLDIGLGNIESAIILLQEVNDIIQDIRNPPASGEEFGIDTIFDHWKMELNEAIKSGTEKARESNLQRQLESEESFLREQGLKFLESSSAASSLTTFNTTGGGTTFDFRGLTIDGSGGNGTQIASDFIAGVEKVLGKQFTMASEVRGNSVLA